MCVGKIAFVMQIYPKKGKKTMRFFEEIGLEIVRFDAEDVITTSEEWNDSDELEEDKLMLRSLPY